MADPNYQSLVDSWMAPEQGLIKALGVEEPNPAKAAENLSLSKTLGLPYEGVKLDPDQAKRELYRRQVTETLNYNDKTASWLHTTPGAADLASEDIPNLTKIEEHFRNKFNVGHLFPDLGKAFKSGDENEITMAALRAAKDNQNDEVLQMAAKRFGGLVAEKFQEGFGDQPIATAQVSPEEVQKATSGIMGLSGALGLGLTDLGIGTFDLMGRTFSGLVHATAGTVGEAVQEATGIPASRTEKELGSFLEWYFMRGDIHATEGSKPPEGKVLTESQRILHNAEVDRQNSSLLQYLKAGEIPPPGVHPGVDKLLAEEAKAKGKRLEEIERDVDKVSFKETAPEELKSFLRSLSSNDMGVSAEAILRLYKDGSLGPGDKLLGDSIPGLRNQLAIAQETDGDVKISMAEWLALPKEVREELRPGLRVRPGGMTLEQAESLKEREEKEKEEQDTLPDSFGKGKASITEAMEKFASENHPASKYVEVPEGGAGIYFRYQINPRLRENTLNIANISFENKGTGAFKAYLDHIEKEAKRLGMDYVQVSEIFNRDLIDHLRIKRGYNYLNRSNPPVLRTKPDYAIERQQRQKAVSQLYPRAEALDPAEQVAQREAGLEPLAERVGALAEHAPWYYSAVGRAIDLSKQAKASPEQWLAALRNTPGIKAEEIGPLGLDLEDWLKAQKGPVTKEQLQEYIRANQLEIREVKHTIKPANRDRQLELEKKENEGTLTNQEGDELYNILEGPRPNFTQYTLPGGENPRELYLRLPPKYGEYRLPSAHETGNAASDTNRVLHIFMDDRTIDGKKTLLIKEMQSDWHQAGHKEGYGEASPELRKELADLENKGYDEGGLSDEEENRLDELRGLIFSKKPPAAPFSNTWQELGLKRMLHYASEHGYDQLAWVRGEERAQQYRQGFKAERIIVRQPNPGIYEITAYENVKAPARQVDMVDLEGLKKKLGNSLAKQAEELVRVGDTIPFRLKNFIYGGDFHKELYNQKMVSVVNKLGKKYGAQVKEGKETDSKPTITVEELNQQIREAINRGDREEQQRLAAQRMILEDNESRGIDKQEQVFHTIPITPELRQAAVTQGFPLFDRPKVLDETSFPQGEWQKNPQGFGNYEYIPDELLSPKQLTQKNELVGKVEAIWQKMAPKLKQFEVVTGGIDLNSYGKGNVAPSRGLFFPPGRGREAAIQVSLRYAMDPEGTARHEILHYLRQGFLNDEEWSTLVQEAQRGGWIEKYDIRERYPKASEDILLEEAIADEFKLFDREAKPSEPKTQIEKIMDWVRDLFRQLREAFTPESKLTSRDIFRKIERGEIGGRDRIVGDTVQIPQRERQITKLEAPRQRKANGPLAEPAEGEEPKLFRPGALNWTPTQLQKQMKLMEQERTEEAERQAKKQEALERKKQTEEWKQNKSDMQVKVTDEFDSRPDVSADGLLRTGRWNGKKVGAPIKLGAEFLPKAIGEELKDVVAKDGIDPDILAGSFGYQTGEELVEALRALQIERGDLSPSAFREKAIRQTVDQRMLDKYGNLEDNILQAAREDVATETTMERLHEEMLALGEHAGLTPTFGVKELKAGVKTLFAKDNAKKAMNVEEAFQNAGRAGDAAFRAQQAGEYTEAFKFKQQQVIAMRMAQEAIKFRKERQAFDKKAKALGNRQLAGVEQEYLDQIHSVLVQIGLPVKRSIQDHTKALDGVTLEKFVEDKAGPTSLRTMPIADFLYDPAYQKPLDKMTVEEFRAVRDSIKTLEHNGREWRKVNKRGEAMDLQEAKDKLIAQLESFDPNKPRTLYIKQASAEGLVRSFVASHIFMETMFNRWSRGDWQGIWNQFVYRPLAEAANYESALQKKFSERVRSLKYEGNLREAVKNDIFLDPRTNASFPMTRRNFLAVLANVGNESNFEKLVTKYVGDPKQVGDKVWDWIKRTAKPEDWTYAKGIGEIFKDLKEISDEVDRRQSGLATEDIPVWPVNTGKEVIDGWYYPVIWDRTIPQDNMALKGGKASTEEGPEYYRATTPRSYQKARTGYRGAMSLEIDDGRSRMAQVIHDIAFREAIDNAGKVLYDTSIQMAIQKHSFLGPEVVRELDPWLRSITHQADFNSIPHQAMARVLEFARQNVISTLIGLNPGTVLKHTPTALVNSIKEVGFVPFWKYFGTLLSSRESGQTNWKFALEHSEELQRRHRNYVETLGGSYTQAFGGTSNSAMLEGLGNWRTFIQHIGAYPVAFGDFISAVPSWLAAYDNWGTKMAAEGKEFHHGDAVSFADRAVRRAHNSTAITNRSSIMRANPWFTSLYGFFGNMLNRQVELVWQAGDIRKLFKEGSKEEALKAVPTIATGLIAYVVMPALIEEIVTPLTNDEHESWGWKGAKTLVHGLSASWVGVRDIASFLLRGSDPTMGIMGTGLKGLSDTVRDINQEIVKNKDKSSAILRHGAVALGSATGLVNAQMGKDLGFAYDVLKGKERPRGMITTDNKASWLKGLIGNNPDTWARGLRYGTSRPPQGQR